MSKDINKMSKEELISVVNTLLIERNSKQQPMNKIVVCDVEVESNIDSLDKCKLIINDLIKTNDEFITARKNKIIKDGWGYIN